jgi:hypothetical protein
MATCRKGYATNCKTPQSNTIVLVLVALSGVEDIEIVIFVAVKLNNLDTLLI